LITILSKDKVGGDMNGLVLEGGTFRPVYTAGVLDALLDEKVFYPYVIGVSAGISHGMSYISRQRGRNIEIIKKYRNDKRYLSRRNFLKCRSLFGLDFVYDEVPNKLVPLDRKAFNEYPGRCIVGMTDANTGRAHFEDAKKADRKFTMFRATCALPVFFPPISLNGRKYYDGGLRVPICIEKALKDKCDKFLIVLTQPKGYIKKPVKYDHMAAGLTGFKYPHVKERMLHRYIDYNRQVRICEKLEAQGRAIILRPKYSLNSFEDNMETLEKSYQHGYDMAMERMDEIKRQFQK
jgi:predicted patatin/cPLA2 family phospholipase